MATIPINIPDALRPEILALVREALREDAVGVSDTELLALYLRRTLEPLLRARYRRARVAGAVAAEEAARRVADQAVATERAARLMAEANADAAAAAAIGGIT
mgnify:CR=1 FL=1